MKDKFKKINADKLLFAMELIMLFAIIMIFIIRFFKLR